MQSRVSVCLKNAERHRRMNDRLMLGIVDHGRKVSVSQSQVLHTEIRPPNPKSDNASVQSRRQSLGTRSARLDSARNKSAALVPSGDNTRGARLCRVISLNAVSRSRLRQMKFGGNQGAKMAQTKVAQRARQSMHSGSCQDC